MREQVLTAEEEDRAAREQALDPRRSILLQAPAGSGKTTVLAERYLRLLAEVNEPEEILAITFTRKAAAEMRERVLRALRGELSGERPHEQQQHELAARARAHASARGWRLELHPGRLRIQTIDALSHWIAAQLPVAARAGGRLRVASRPQQLYRLAARRTLADADAETSLQPAIELLFERLDNNHGALEGLLAEMLEKRAHWLRRLLRGADVELHERVARSLQDIVTERIEALARLLPETLMKEGATIARLAALNRSASGDGGDGPWRAWLESSAPLAATPGDLWRWQALVALALASSGDWRRTLTVREGFPPADKTLKARGRDWIESLTRIPEAREALLALAALPAASLPDDDAASLAALAAILTFAAQQLEVVFQEQGQVDYSYVAAAARRALTEEGAPTDLGLRLGARLRHLLLDEFQDTSIDQLELLEALTAGWDRADGSSVFAVGDPMQSIYLFREAEVGLFLRARERGLGSMSLESLRLTRNFRTAPALVEWTNARLARVFPPADDIRTSAVSFLPSTPARAGALPPSIELHCMQAGAAAGEAAAIVSLVQRLRANAAGSSIAILLGSRAHAAPITTALEAAGIAVAGIDLVPLGEVPVVSDLANLACALDHPADRCAWLAVLRAPWCGLTLAELQTLVDGDAGATIPELLRESARLASLGPDARLRAQRTLTVLEEALAERDRLPLAVWIEATWHALGGPAACTSDADIRHAEAFFTALARRAQAPDWRGPAELDELLGELYAGNPDAPADAVQIMTVHAAKGLEFDHVVLPGLGRRMRPDREPLMRWIELPRLPQGNDLLIAPLPAPGSRERHPISELIRGLQRERQRNERARLLYVALTRARQGLYLFGHLCPPRAGESAGRPESGTLLELLWPAIGGEFPAAPERVEPAAAAPRQPQRLERLPAAWRAPPLEPAPRVDSLRVAVSLREDAGPPSRGAAAIELTGILEGELVSVHIDRTFVDAAGTRWVVTMLGEKPAALQDPEAFVAEQLRRHAPQLRRAAGLARLRLGPEPVRAALYLTALGEMRALSEDA